MRRAAEITEDEFRAELARGGWHWRADVKAPAAAVIFEHEDGRAERLTLEATTRMPQQLAGAVRAVYMAAHGPGHRCPCCEVQARWMTAEEVEDNGGAGQVYDLGAVQVSDVDPDTDRRLGVPHEEGCEARPESVDELRKDFG